MTHADVIIIGAGSIGLPLALALAERGIRPLVIDQLPSPGQGENKHAIGGIRATHSDPAKILVCNRSIDIFATWQENFGDDIEWQRGGYVFPVYEQAHAELLQSFLPVQKKYGLNIDYVSPEKIRSAVPGIQEQGLMGGTVSPDDGSASPLLAINAFYRRARQLGVAFQFNSAVEELIVEGGKVVGVRTATDAFHAPVVVDACGARSRQLAALVGYDLPVVPDSHEAGITEPAERFFQAMVVDLRKAPGSANFYFYQSRHGQVVFCITPDPPIVGSDYRETSDFLPQICRRLVTLMPRLKNLRVRRVWRGLYPMSPDGSPLVGWNPAAGGLLHVAGTCGQGFMLGPGLGEVAARLIDDALTADDQVILDGFSLERSFGGMEALK